MKTIFLKQVKDQLDNISQSFCVAKWKQVTMHLQNGHTHSCHHPSTHKIPIEEIALNPSALHNTNYKKLQRKLMLEGLRPEECEYCWTVEDNENKNLISDRIIKSASNWAVPYIDEISKLDWTADVFPSYVEVNFGNTCNFKCSYCNPSVSSLWMEEIKNFGPYPTSGKFNSLDYLKSTDQLPIPSKEMNPYIDAFWQWWPKSYQNLEIFRITGGEPLLNKNTFKILNYILENKNANLELGINTNLNPPHDIFEKFIDRCKRILDNGNVKLIKIFTSAEAHGDQADYIRFGMNYNTWLENVYRLYREIPNIEVSIMSTYNLLSIFSYEKFLKDIYELKSSFSLDFQGTPLFLDIPYLRYPEHQSIFIAEEFMKSYIREQLIFLQKHNLNNHKGFYDLEIEKFARISNLVNDHHVQEVDKKRKDFIIFVDEHDRRRGTNFLHTFPQMKDTYQKWKLL